MALAGLVLKASLICCATRPDGHDCQMVGPAKSCNTIPLRGVLPERSPPEWRVRPPTFRGMPQFMRAGRRERRGRARTSPAEGLNKALFGLPPCSPPQPHDESLVASGAKRTSPSCPTRPIDPQGERGVQQRAQGLVVLQGDAGLLLEGRFGRKSSGVFGV